MIRKLVERLFLQDALLKAISLVLAAALFVFVRGDRDVATGTHVKVIYVLPRDRVLVSEPVSEIRVGLRGPWTRVSRLEVRDLPPIRADLSNFPGGEFYFNENMLRLPVGVRLSSLTPPSVHLQIEPRVERSIPIQPRIEGDPASGYRVLRVQTRPREVRVSGPKGVVEAVGHVLTRPFRIEEARAPLRGSVRLTPPPPRSGYVDADEVDVEIEIGPALIERTLRAVPVRVTGLSQLAGSIAPSTVAVVLHGARETVASVTAASLTIGIDAQGEDGRPPGSHRKRISVSGLPSGVTAQPRPDAVTLVTRRRHR